MFFVPVAHSDPSVLSYELYYSPIDVQCILIIVANCMCLEG